MRFNMWVSEKIKNAIPGRPALGEAKKWKKGTLNTAEWPKYESDSDDNPPPVRRRSAGKELLAGRRQNELVSR